MSAITAAPPLAAHQLRGPPGPAVAGGTVQTATQASEPDLSGPVEAELSFFDAPKDGEKPYNWAGAHADSPPNGIPRNFGSDTHTVRINDIRDHESDFSLSRNAFATISGIKTSMTPQDWDSDSQIRSIYYPEVEKLMLNNVPGANRVYLFDYTIRKPGATRAPVTRVHIDQTAQSTQARVKHHLPDEAATLLQSRYRIINLWLPLNPPVVSHPLAFASSSSVRSTDLVGVEHRYPDRTGETAAVKFDAGQEWWYWSGMRAGEALLLQCFDSEDEMGRVPHSAFVDPRTPEGARGRESVEVRGLVFG